MNEYLDPNLAGIILALGLGMLIGMEREWADSRLGLRTLTLLSGTGAAAVVLAARFGNLVVVAALVTYLMGAMAGAGMWPEAVVLAAATMLLLHWKQPLHRWIDQIGAGEERQWIDTDS